ncbi:N-glycosylase/DNA lyase-like [Paramacrobiotus metropolitanus]|uniref:N-glycosylase/DNA lyase-like n=1 Tax=Paramacrobiotus metropolitanus TaxID=2943436 RepID=UPI002445DED4|nr:N-glycosylase/DNA lyase-like [Paramacrobiotus metropolitanus]
MSWSKFPCSTSEVMLDFVLACGQSFRWTKNASGEWIGVIGRCAWKMKQTEECVEYQVFTQAPQSAIQIAKRSRGFATGQDVADISGESGDHAVLKQYFAIDTFLQPLYAQWSAADERFAHVAPRYGGIRILQQDFIENVFSFICSSNNNIARIQQMVEKLCARYGDLICEVDGKKMYAFPAVERLAQEGVEEELRKMGFGYRAAFVHGAAKHIAGDSGWISRTKCADYPTAKELLMELPGVGAKVADCICLMSLGHHQAVPVDTHVFSVTAQHYLPHLRQVKSVTKRVYNEIGEFYRNRFGGMAGWAHSVLFTADLRQFKEAASDNGKVGNNNINKRKRRLVECD